MYLIFAIMTYLVIYDRINTAAKFGLLENIKTDKDVNALAVFLSLLWPIVIIVFMVMPKK